MTDQVEGFSFLIHTTSMPEVSRMVKCGKWDEAIIVRLPPTNPLASQKQSDTGK